MSCFKPEWGNQNFMLLCAFRYCLGRYTYASSECSEFLIKYWEEIDRETKELILREIKKAIEQDCAGYADNIEDWKKVLEHSEKKRA